MTDFSRFAISSLMEHIESYIESLPLETSGKTLGIVGFGQLGQDVANLARRRFGMKIVVFDIRPVSDDALAAVDGQRADSLEELLPLCDVVSLNCTREAETLLLMNAMRLNLMKEEAYLINAVHRDVVDERALTQALWFDTIGGAALGGFDSESRIDPDLSECDTLHILPFMKNRGVGTATNRFAGPSAPARSGHIPGDRVA